MHVALINAPVAKRSPHARLAPPLGLAYLGAVLLREGHEVSAIDFNVSGLNWRRVDRLVESGPEVVGISAHTETYPNALEIARRVKALNPKAAVVLGGPHPTLLPEGVLAEEAVDFVVLGEGEETLLELIETLAGEGKDLAEIKGLGYKEGGALRIN
ncbi:MAG: cobalamin-dependent protein [Bacillota bacterium]|nr:cobalamin-dependent protein [Bacillota bacterium]